MKLTEVQTGQNFDDFYKGDEQISEYFEFLKESSDDENVNIMITRVKENIKTNITVHVLLLIKYFVQSHFSHIF